MPKAKLDSAYEILLDYGYIEPGVSDREYWEALKQATLDFKEENNVEYFDIVRAEEKELRDKVVPKIKKTKISAEAFKKGTSQDIKPNNEVTSLAIVPKKPDVTAKDITPEIPEPESEEKKSPFSDSFKNILNSIAGTTESIKNLLLGQQKGEKQAVKDAKKRSENVERSSREKKIESKIFDGVKKVGEKIIQPVKSLWERIWGFLKTLILSAVVGKLFKWFSNPKNKEKVQSVLRFIKDWWPALLTGFLLFGTGLGSLITGTVGAIAGFIPTLALLLPKLIAFAASPIGLAVLGTAAVVGGTMWAVNKIKGDNKDNKIEASEPVQMNKGGSVPGKGNTDTVPAMLTPGEFVLTKEATQKYGTDTLEGMNAAAASGKKETSGIGRGIGSAVGGLAGGIVGFFADSPVSPVADIALGIAGSTAGGEIGDKAERKVRGMNNGGVVQYLNNGGKVISTSENATMRGGKVVSGNMSQSSADYNQKKLQLEKARFQAISTYGFNSPEVNQIKKQLLILDGTPAEAIVIPKGKGEIKVKGYSTYSGENRRSIPKKSEKNPANFLQPQGFAGKDSKKPQGLGRMLTGAADMMTGGWFDFDKRGNDMMQTIHQAPIRALGGMLGIGHGGKRPEGMMRNIGGVADQVTGGLFDFDKRGRGFGDKPEGVMRMAAGLADAMTGNLTDFDKRGGKTFGTSRVLAGAADALTGNRWDFDKHGKPSAKVTKVKPKSPEISPPGSSQTGSAGVPNITTVNMDGSIDNPVDLTKGQEESSKSIPNFSATIMRSRDKIKTLGIMV